MFFGVAFTGIEGKDHAGRIYRRDAGKNRGDAGLHRYHHPEHPRTVRLRRGAERDLRQPAEDEVWLGEFPGALNGTGDVPVIKRRDGYCM